MTGTSMRLTMLIFLSAGLLAGAASAAELDVGPVEVKANNGNDVKGIAIFPDEVLELERVEGPAVLVRFDRIHRLVFKEVTHVERSKLTLRVAVYELQRLSGGSIEGFIRASRPVTFRLKNKERVKEYEIGPGNPVREMVFTGNVNRAEKEMSDQEGQPKRELSQAAKEYTIIVPGNTQWLRTGISLTRDQRIHITASGSIKWGTDPVGKEVGPDGRPHAGRQGRPMPGNNLGMLIARFRPLFDKRYIVGSDKKLKAPMDSELELGINDDELGDNTGNFRVHIVVEAN